MLWDDFKKNYNNYIEQPIEELSIDVLRNMYKDLAYIATEWIVNSFLDNFYKDIFLYSIGVKYFKELCILILLYQLT